MVIKKNKFKMCMHECVRVTCMFTWVGTHLHMCVHIHEHVCMCVEAPDHLSQLLFTMNMEAVSFT